MVNRRSSEPPKESVPTNFAETNPRQVQHGHDFTLQVVMEMQRSIGELASKTDRLISDVKSQGDKLDVIRHRFSWLAGIGATVGFLIALGLAAAKFLPLAVVGIGH